MMHKAVLIDTCFLIKLLDSKSDLHQNAVDYFKYFLKEKIIIKISTISIAEYCVKGDINDIPLQNLQVLPFNILHSVTAGQFASTVFKFKKAKLATVDRSVIPNDTKLFSQANQESNIGAFVTCDATAKKIVDIISMERQVNFEFWDINDTVQHRFGIIPFVS